MRLKGRDYSAPGLYFVTICATQKRCIFGRVKDRRVQSTALGQVAQESWMGIPVHFAPANLHAFVIMPNHMHGIVEITQIRLAQHAARLQGNSWERLSLIGS
jgi:putative transposase